MQRTLTALALLGLTTTAAVAEGPEGIILNQIATGDQIGTNIAVVQGSSTILNGDALRTSTAIPSCSTNS